MNTGETKQGTMTDLPAFQATDEQIPPEPPLQYSVTSYKVPTCTCEAFEQNYSKLGGGGDILLAVHGIPAPQVDEFQFCPWCGGTLDYIEHTELRQSIPGVDAGDTAAYQLQQLLEEKSHETT